MILLFSGSPGTSAAPDSPPCISPSRESIAKPPFVLPFAIDRFTTVAAGPRDDGVLRCHSLQMSDERNDLAAVAEYGEEYLAVYWNTSA